MRQLIALCLVVTLLVVFSSSAMAALATSAVAQPETDNSEETVSVWDRIWPVLIAVGSFFLFRFLRNRPTDED